MPDDASRTVTKAKHCQRCNQDVTALLVRKISGSGVSMVYWQCPYCKDAIDKLPKWIKHDQLKAYGIDPEKLPVAGDYRQQHACAVCGSLDTEYHHFAPRYLFGAEAELWPVAYLCRRHHQQWHNLVTPDMSRRRKE